MFASSFKIVGVIHGRAIIEIENYIQLARIVMDDTAFKFRPIAYKIQENGCHICMSHLGNLDNYPSIRINRKIFKISRLIYEWATGIKPGELMVLHNCDNPECINPAHLRLGTAKDNVHDWLERGKSPYASNRKPRRLQRKSLLARYHSDSTISQQPKKKQSNYGK